MVGAANSDSARISFFGSTKRELAQKLDRGQDAVGRRRLTQVPPEPREMVAYYTAQKLCLGCVGTYYSSSVRRTQGLGLLRGLPTECNGTHSAELTELLALHTYIRR